MALTSRTVLWSRFQYSTWVCQILYQTLYHDPGAIAYLRFMPTLSMQAPTLINTGSHFEPDTSIHRK